MRTTVNLPDHIYVEARRLAAERKTSLTALLEEALRSLLSDARRAPTAKPAPELPFMDGGAPKKGVDLNDTSKLWET